MNLEHPLRNHMNRISAKVLRFHGDMHKLAVTASYHIDLAGCGVACLNLDNDIYDVVGAPFTSARNALTEKINQ